MDADAIVVGAGLAGLVAAAELADAGRKVIVLDQEPEGSLGGQAFWSFGGLFFVDSPEQRRMRVRDSRDLALQDWLGSAGFDRDDDHWPRRWAEAYVDFAAGEKRAWLRAQGLKIFPIVGWAERGGYLATGHGNSVPRFHVTWGTGPGVIEPFVRRVREAESRGLVSFRFRHRVTALTKTGGAVDGVRGDILEPSNVARGTASSRRLAGSFALGAQAIIVTSGGIGGNHDLVRRHWPKRLGEPPRHMISGVPEHVDGLMLDVVKASGGTIINSDRMWHYPEGIQNYAPIWSRHGIRILSGPSPLWLDARGRRLPVPLFPGFDSLGALAHITREGHDHSWFLLNERIIGREFALSGSEQNPDLTERSIKLVLGRIGKGAPEPVKRFMERGADFVIRKTLPELVAGMNQLGGNLIDAAELEREVVARDRAIDNTFGKDAQVIAIRAARQYLGDKLIRVAKPHKILDPAAGPLIAVKLHVLTRKTLGGLQTDLSSRVLQGDGAPLPGVYAAGEVAGFGGGGVHGYRALEGTFLGGCIFSGRIAGREAARAVG
ncbi:MAG TPA: FAD-binding dehydrogenase [Xanthobacteraceae bacterium]|nr:FAD-binding dehydrogenase [Xanthobacteraceae bacterium]